MTDTASPQMTAWGIRFVADQQLMTDMDGANWYTEVLAEAQERGEIAGFQVLGSWPTVWGIQHVAFTVDVPLIEGTTWTPDLTAEEAKAKATDMLNRIVGDSDVEVRVASPLMDPPIDPEDIAGTFGCPAHSASGYCPTPGHMEAFDQG